MAKIIISGGGASSASYADYINNSKGGMRADEKIIFNVTESGLSQKSARKSVSDKKSEKAGEKFIKLFFSQERNNFRKLGETEPERLAATEAIVRESLENLWNELGVKDVRWVAGTHLNTNNPHTHILFNVAAASRTTGEKLNVPKIPRSWFWRQNNDNSILAKFFEAPVAAHTLATPPENVRTKLPETEFFFPPRAVSSEQIDKTLNRLSEIGGISAHWIEKLTDNQSLYVNRRGGLTFVRRDVAGYATGYVYEDGSPSEDEKGFFYVGNPKTAARFIIAESPKEVLAILELTGHRDLSEVCIVAADEKNAPAALTEFLKENSGIKPLRVIWALGLNREDVQEAGNYADLQIALLERRPEKAPPLEFISWQPKPGYGHSWNDQIDSKNRVGELKGIIRKVVMADAPEIEPLDQSATESYYEKIGETFRTVEIVYENDQFIVYGRNLETRGIEYGRFIILPVVKANDSPGDDLPEYRVIGIGGQTVDVSMDEQLPAGLLKEESDAVELIKNLFREKISAESLAAEGESAAEIENEAASENFDQSTEAAVDAEQAPEKESAVAVAAEVIDDFQSPKKTAREITEELKNIPLEDVMATLGLSLTYDRERREYVYRDNGAMNKIKVKNDLFCDRYNDNRGGKNAINLVMQVRGSDFADARAFLMDNLGANYIPQETPDKVVLRAATEKSKIPFVMPERNDDKLHIVRDYLTSERGLDTAVVDAQIEAGNIFANSFGSNTFVYKNEDGVIKGAAWRAVQGSKRGDYAGTDKVDHWFYIGDLKNAGRFIVVEAPIEAMSYLQLHPEVDLKTTAIVSTSMASVPAGLIRLLEKNAGENSELIIAYNNDKGGQRGAEFLLEKTGRFVLLNHKEHHANNLIETTKFSGKILREVPRLEDWNEDVKAARDTADYETGAEDTGDEIDSISRPEILPQIRKTSLDSLVIKNMEGWNIGAEPEEKISSIEFNSISEFNDFIQKEKSDLNSRKMNVRLVFDQGGVIEQTFVIGAGLPDTLTELLNREIEALEFKKNLEEFEDLAEDLNQVIGKYKYARSAAENIFLDELKAYDTEDNPDSFNDDVPALEAFAPEKIRAVKISTPLHFQGFGKAEILLARENDKEPFFNIGYRIAVGAEVIEKVPAPGDEKFAQGRQSLSNAYDEARKAMLGIWQEKGEPRYTLSETEINPDENKYLAYLLNKTETQARDFSVRSFEKSFSVIPEFSKEELSVLRQWKERTTGDGFFRIENVFYKEIPNARPYQNLMYKLVGAGLVEVSQENAYTLVKGGNPLTEAALSYLKVNAALSLRLTVAEARQLELQERKNEYATRLAGSLRDDDRDYYERQYGIIKDELEQLSAINEKKSLTEVTETVETPETAGGNTREINLGENPKADYELLEQNPLKGIYDRQAHLINVAFNEAYKADVELTAGFEFNYRDRLVTVLDTEENGMLLNFRIADGKSQGKNQNYTLGNLIHEKILGKEDFEKLVAVTRTRQEIKTELSAANMNLDYKAAYAPNLDFNGVPMRLNSRFSEGDYVLTYNPKTKEIAFDKYVVEKDGENITDLFDEAEKRIFTSFKSAVAHVADREEVFKTKQAEDAAEKFKKENTAVADYLTERFGKIFMTGDQKDRNFLNPVGISKDSTLIGYADEYEIKVFRKETRAGMIALESQENPEATEYASNKYLELGNLEAIGDEFTRRLEILHPAEAIVEIQATDEEIEHFSEDLDAAEETQTSAAATPVAAVIAVPGVRLLPVDASTGEIERTLTALFNARFAKDNYDFTVTVAAAKDENRAFDLTFNSAVSHENAQYRIYPPSKEFNEWSALKNNYNPIKSNKVLNFELTDKSFKDENGLVEFTAKRIIKNEGLLLKAPMLVPTVLASPQQEGRIEKRISKLINAHGLGEQIANSEEFYVVLKNEPYMDLHITKDYGTNLIRLTHWYIQNGDMMHDGEMNFRLKEGKLSLNQVGVALYGTPRYSYDRTFANMFSNNLIQQGFEKATVVQMKDDESQIATAETVENEVVVLGRSESIGDSLKDAEIVADNVSARITLEAASLEDDAQMSGRIAANENHLVSQLMPPPAGNRVELTEAVSMLKTKVWLPQEIVANHLAEGAYTFNDTLSNTGRTATIYTERDINDFKAVHGEALSQLGLEGEFSDSQIESQRENAELYADAVNLQNKLDESFAARNLRNPFFAVAEIGSNNLEIHGRTLSGKPDGMPLYSFYETELPGSYQIGVGNTYPASQYQPEDFYFRETDDYIFEYGRAIAKLTDLLSEETNISQNRIETQNRVQLGSQIEPAGVKKGTISLAEEVREILHSGASIGNNVAFNKMAERNFGGSRAAGTFSARDAYDALELGVNLYLLDRAKTHDFFAKPTDTLREMRDLLRRLPTQSDRTDEQNLYQQFSTPPTEGFSAYVALGAKKGDKILEPSAGNAGLAIWARMQGVDVHVNEISDRRAGILKILGFNDVTRKDAQFLNDTLDRNIKPSLVLMNPPFSSTGGRTANNRTKYGAEHITDALTRLSPGGRLVAIVGEGMGFGKQGFTQWWSEVFNKYTVRANVGVPGEEYGKYGTTFGNQILVIDKIGATPGKTMQEQLATVIKGDMPDLETVLTQMVEIAETRPESKNFGVTSLAEAKIASRNTMLLPETVDLSPLEAVWFAENQDKLNRLGYETVALNDKTIAIKTSPTNIGFDEVRENFMNSLSALGNKEAAPVVIPAADDELFADQNSNIGRSQENWTYDLDYRQEGYAKSVWNKAGDNESGAEYLVAVNNNGSYVNIKEIGLSQDIQKEIYLSELNHGADDLVTLVEVNHDNPGTVFAALNKTSGELIHVRNEDLKPGDYNNVIYKSTLNQITRVSSITKELKESIKQFAADNPALYKEVKGLPTKVYDIGAGSMGNGTTIWNRADEENRDYKRIAHIGETGVISIYEKEMPESAMLEIYSHAFSDAGEKEILVPFNPENEKVAFAVVNKETGEVFSVGKNFEGKENQQIVIKNEFATVVKNYDGLAPELKAGVDRLRTENHQLYSELTRSNDSAAVDEQERYNLARTEATGAIPGRLDRLEAAGYRVKFGEADEAIKDILVGKLSGYYAERFLGKGLTIEPITFNKVERQDFISRANLAANRDKIYLFGDNVRRTGFGGQAAEMRGESNAFGIPTKMNPSNHPAAFFTDENLLDNKIAINEGFAKLAKYAPDTVIVIPTAGLGTGLADLERRAPQTFAFLQEKLTQLDAAAALTTEAMANIETAAPNVLVGSTQETVQLQMSILEAVPVKERELEINDPLEAINLYEAGAIVTKGVTGYSETHGGEMDADWEESQIARLVINGATENQVVSLIKQFEDVTQDVAITVDGRNYKLSVTNDSFVENVLAVYQRDLQDDAAENKAERAYELEEDIDYGGFVQDDEEEIETEGLIQLNEKELAVFASAAQEIVDNSGGQFGFLSNAKTPEGMMRAEFAGYTGSLVSKGLITVEEESKQVQMTATGANELRRRGLFRSDSFELPGMEWSMAVEPKEAAQTSSAVDREATIYQPALNIKKQITEILKTADLEKTLAVEINQSENAARPEVFAILEPDSRREIIATISKTESGFTYQSTEASSAIVAVGADKLADYLKEDVAAKYEYLSGRQAEYLAEVAKSVGKSYSDTATVLNHYLTAQGRNDLEASVLIINDGNRVESWINIVRYDYAKVEKNVIGRVTQGTDSFAFVIGTEENEVYDIETLARYLIEAETKLTDQQKNATRQEPAIPAIDMKVYEAAMSQRPEFEWDADNNFSPEEIRADYFKEIFAYGEAVLQLDRKTSTTVYLNKKAELEHKKNVASLGQNKSDLAFHVSETGEYFGAASENYIRGELEARQITITEDYDVLFGKERTSYLETSKPVAIEGIRVTSSESENVFKGGENIDRVFKSSDEFNRFILSTAKPEDPQLYFKTDFEISLTDGIKFSGNIDLGEKELQLFETNDFVKEIVEADGKSAANLLADYNGLNNVNSTAEDAAEYQTRINTADRIVNALAAEIPVNVNQKTESENQEVSGELLNEQRTNGNGLGNNSAVHNGTRRGQPNLFEQPNLDNESNAGYERGNADVSVNENQSANGNGKIDGNQPAVAVSSAQPAVIGNGNAASEGIVSGSDQRESGTSLVNKLPAQNVPENITTAALGIGKNTEKRQRIDNLGVVEYKPAKLQGGVAHPGDIVESASMAAVVTPDITYTPRLDRRLVEDGLLSSLQLETVIYAGQRHEMRLGDGSRAGFFIGDGTGVGKGRELAGIALDNWNQGRQRILWLSINYDLVPSTERDMKGLGAGHVPFHTLNKHTVHTSLEESVGDGLLFASYATLTGKGKDGATRFDQITEWLGEDGVIMFDEGHLAKNAVSFGMQNASQRGEAVVDLQIGEKSNPNWRIVYSSATGATELRNMAYMQRLGLWGEGSGFPGGFIEFHNTIDKGGVGAMEMVARDMKAAGMYCSRSLSMRGVDYRSVHHALTPEQKEIYNVAARAWADVARGFDDALNTTNANGKAKGMAKARLYSGQQMFFRQLMTALKVPALIAETERVQKEGSGYVDPTTGATKHVPAQIVIGVIGTGEARTKEQVSKAAQFGLDLDDLDFSPKQILLNVVESAFPTKRFTEEYDPMSGHTIKVPVVDADGRQVESQEALAMRDALLHELEEKVTLPDHPLDQIVNYFGEGAVAEITGRNKRIIVDPDTGNRSYVKRAREGVAMDKASQDEMNAFQTSRKKIAIISQSASTGISLHAEVKPLLENYVAQKKLTAERAAAVQQEWDTNADVEKVREMLQPHDLDIFRRVHITLETSWSADTQMQTFGRTHRSNELLPPEYLLMSSDLGGEKRFLSTIAKRLGSLGALTKGDREQAGGGNLLEYDFENKYGSDAAKKIITMMRDGKPAFMTLLPPDPQTGEERGGMELLYRMGLARREGNLFTVPDKVLEDLEVGKFLNRVLMLDVDTQNAVFDGFVTEMEAFITHDKELGLFDEGVKDIEGTNIRLAADPQVVSTDKMSGAETIYYKISADTPTAPVTLAEIEDRHRVVRIGGMELHSQNNKGVFYQQRNSKNVIYTEYASTRSEAETGAMVRHYKYARPNGWQSNLLTEKDLLDKYVPVRLEERREFEAETVLEVKEWWNKEVAETPPSRVQDYHLIAGAVLPVWQRLASTNDKGDQMSLKTVRIETEDGERIVGVEIPARHIHRVLRDLGVQQSFKSPEEIFDAVLETKETIDLVGGIRLRPTFLKKQPAIEIMNLSVFQKNEFQNYGAQKEIISFSDKYYVPTEKAKGIEVLSKVLSRYPAVDKTEERVTAQTVIAENKAAGIGEVINKAIENLSIKNFGDGALAKVSEKSTGFAAQAAHLKDQPLAEYWWMMTAEANAQGQVKINAATYEFVRVAYRRTFHEDIKTFDGLFDDSERADRFMQTMDYIEENSGIYGEAVATLTKTIAEARNSREDQALIFLTDDKLSTRQHEESHAVSYSASLGKSLIERHARFDELVASEAYVIAKPILAKLRGTDDDGLLVEETFAYISSGEGWKVGLLPDETADFGTLWYKSFAEKNGDISILKFKEMTDESKQIRDGAYRQIKLEREARELIERNGVTAGKQRGGLVGDAKNGLGHSSGDTASEPKTGDETSRLADRKAEIESNLLLGYQIEEENSFKLHPALYQEVSKNLTLAREFIENELPVLRSEGMTEDVYFERLKEFNFEPLERGGQTEAFLNTAYENIYVTTTGEAVIFRGGETHTATDEIIMAAAVERQLKSENFFEPHGVEIKSVHTTVAESQEEQKMAEPQKSAIEQVFQQGERVGAGVFYKLAESEQSAEISEILEDYGMTTPEGNDVKILASFVEKYPQATEELISFAADRDLLRDERFDQMNAEQMFDSSEARFEMYARQISRENDGKTVMPENRSLYKMSGAEGDEEINGDAIFTEFQSILRAAKFEKALEANGGSIKFETAGANPDHYEMEIGAGEIKFTRMITVYERGDYSPISERGITFGKNSVGSYQYTGSFERDLDSDRVTADYDQVRGYEEVQNWKLINLQERLIATEVNFGGEIKSVIEESNRANLEKYLSRQLGNELLAEIKTRAAEFEATEFQNNLVEERLPVTAEINGKEVKREISFADLKRESRAIARSQVTLAKTTGILAMIGKDDQRPPEAVEKQQYAKEMTKAEAMQKPWTEALGKIVAEKQARLAENTAAARAGLEDEQRETRSLTEQSGAENISALKPTMAPEKVWLEQIKAVKRADTEIFVRLEEINQAKGVPRPNDVFARLRGMETIAMMNARREHRSLVEWVGKDGTHQSTVIVNVRAEQGELKVENWRVREVEQKFNELTGEVKENRRAAEGEQKAAHRAALQPLINQLNPLAPVRGTLSWITKPGETFNARMNPIEAIKNGPGLQLIRAVAGYIEHKGKARQLNEMSSAAIEKAAYLRNQLAPRVTQNADRLAAAAGAAIESEAALRNKLKADPTINAELLDYPGRALTDAEHKQIGKMAAETGDMGETRQYHDLLKNDAEFAAAIGENKEILTAKSLMAEARAAWHAGQAVNNIELLNDGSVDVELNPAQLRQARDMIETADLIEEVQTAVAGVAIVHSLSLEEIAQAEQFLGADNQIAAALNNQVANLGQNLILTLQAPLNETEQKIFKEMTFTQENRMRFDVLKDQGMISDIMAQQAEMATQNRISFQQTAHNFTVTNPNDALEAKEMEFWKRDRVLREANLSQNEEMQRNTQTDAERTAQDSIHMEEAEALEVVEAEEVAAVRTLILG